MTYINTVNLLARAGRSSLTHMQSEYFLLSSNSAGKTRRVCIYLDSVTESYNGKGFTKENFLHAELH